MARRKPVEPPPVEPRVFSSAEEIDFGIKKLRRRITELEGLNVQEAMLGHTGADDVVISNIRDTIRDVFGLNSPEFREHEHIRLWAGPLYLNMDDSEVVRSTQAGVGQTRGILEGLIARLEEKKEDMAPASDQASPLMVGPLNLHPRVSDVASELFDDGYHWEAVFAAAKALVNYVKERSGKHDLDGAPLMRSVFSRNAPILAFNDLSDQTDGDEQEGMMHLFEGAVLAIRPRG
jgi:uncharacterized protein (TIGR02391 family)